MTDTLISRTQSPKTVFSLTYHEITKDPRVLKEARALKAAGHDVHIFCDWAAGLPQHDEIDGIRVTRFDWQSPEHINTRTLDRYPFLNRVMPEVENRFVPYAEHAEEFHRVQSLFAQHFSAQDVARLDPKYYKKYKGIERIRRKRAHLLTALKVWIKRRYFKLPKFKKMTALNRQVRQKRKELFQLTGLVFAENLCRLKFDQIPDVIHAHDIYCLPGGVALAKQFDAKLVYDAHEYEPARAMKNPENGENFAEALEDDCLVHVDHMITVSRSIADLYAKRFKAYPTLIFNAPEVDPDFESALADVPVALAVRQQAQIPPEGKLVVFTGGVQTAHRGLDRVLAALAQLPDVYLASLGPRIEKDDTWLTDIAKSLGVLDRVRLLPPVDARDVPLAISSADVAVSPIQDVSLSYRFCMPNKLFEAAFAKVPICVSDLPDMRNFVEELGCGRAMLQTNPDSIAQALRDVLDSPYKYTLTPENNERLWQEYSWPAQIRRLVELYDRM